MSDSLFDKAKSVVGDDASPLLRENPDPACPHTSQVWITSQHFKGPIFTVFQQIGHAAGISSNHFLGTVTIHVCSACHRIASTTCNHDNNHWYDRDGKIILDISANIDAGVTLRCDLCGMDVT